MSRFVHLHTHTEYSVLDGMGRLGDLARAAASDGQPALAITDHGTLGGAWAFDKACRSAGIKPIIGCEMYRAIGPRFDPQELSVPAETDVDGGNDEKGTGRKRKRYEHLTVLAASPRGWRSLVAIHNASQQSFRYKPLIDFDLLAAHPEGLIVLTGCLGGPLAAPLSRAQAHRRAGDVGLARAEEDTARANLEAIIGAVGAENVYVEVMDHGIGPELDVLAPLRALAGEFGLECVATNDAHYTHADDAGHHEAWLACQSHATITDPKRFRFHGSGYHLRTREEMIALHPDDDWWVRACDNTAALADRVADSVLPARRSRLPAFPLTPPGLTDAQYLHRLVRDGARRRWGRLSGELKARLRHEEDVIVSMGFASYFLIVWEMISWANAHGILSGPGRGSAAGSATATALGITAVDPLRHGLLFERFLEPGRVGMPDIDTDFEQDRVGDVIDHLRDLYGADNVARIGTWGTEKSKGAIKAAARVLGFPPGPINRLTKEIPVAGGKPAPLADLLDPTRPDADEFRRTIASVPAPPASGYTFDDVLAHAAAFENVVDSVGIHACGVVVSADPLTEEIPLRIDRRDPRRFWVAEWTGGEVEEVGALKLDLLGLRNLDIISRTLAMLPPRDGHPFTLADIPDPDDADGPGVAEAMAMLAAGETDGCFQVESRGMRELLGQIVPDAWDDLTAVGAIFRPGPLGAGTHRHYAARKHGEEPVSYDRWTDDPEEAALLDTVLGPTYGLIVYQEQLMQLGRLVAGFDAAQRSRLRKAIGKKKADEMAAVGDMFVERAETRVTDPATGDVVSPRFARSTAEALWADMKASGEYSFNKSHAAAYGLVTWITAWLKANHPVEFGAAALIQTTDDDKRRAMLDALGRAGVSVAPPDVNEGLATTAVTGPGTIRLGLGEIKGVGQAAAAIVAEREAGGPFTCAADLARRVRVADQTDKTVQAVQADKADRAGAGRPLPSSVVDALIEAGAADGFGPRLGQLMAHRAGEAVRVDAEWGNLERAARQRERLGTLMGPHPVRAFRHWIGAWRAGGREAGAAPDSVRRVLALDLAPGEAPEAVVVAGLLVRWQRRTYSGGQMAGWTLEGGDGSRLEGVTWDQTVTALLSGGTEPVPGQLVAISGLARSRLVQVATADEDDPDRVTETITRIEVTMTRLWHLDPPDPSRIDLPAAPRLDLAGLTSTPPPPAALPARPGPAPVTFGPDWQRACPEGAAMFVCDTNRRFDPRGAREIHRPTGPALSATLTRAKASVACPRQADIRAVMSDGAPQVWRTVVDGNPVWLVCGPSPTPGPWQGSWVDAPVPGWQRLGG